MGARRVVIAVGLLVVGVPARRQLQRLARRSGATDAELARPLPGDDLVPDAELVMDRVLRLPAPAERVWPWLVQLGKGRAGWYLPARVERFVPRRRRAARSLDDRWQGLRVGDRVPDWGPGDPQFELAAVDAPRSLVYLSLRQRSAGWRWPAADAADADVLALSWALVLEPAGFQACRLQLRLRMRTRSRAAAVLGGLFDYATVRLLASGLAERVGQPRGGG